jgi:hypothetical protein
MTPYRKIHPINIIGNSPTTNLLCGNLRDATDGLGRGSAEVYEIYGGKPGIYSQKIADSEESSAFCLATLPQHRPSPVFDNGY